MMTEDGACSAAWGLGGGGFDLTDPKSPIADQMSRSYDLVMNGWELGSGSVLSSKASALAGGAAGG